MRKHCALPPRGGFTLIELLCVIAIIGILVAMAMPAYSNFRDKTDGVKCSSNLRQIGAAVQAYVGQNDGMFPEIQTDPNHPDPGLDPQAKGLLATLEMYGLSEDVVKCPADVRNPAFNYFKKRGTSYEWAPYVDDEPQTDPQIYSRRGQMTISPSRIVMCSDTEQVHGLRGDFRSKKNYLYADGHIRNYWETNPKRSKN